MWSYRDSTIWLLRKIYFNYKVRSMQHVQLDIMNQNYNLVTILSLVIWLKCFYFNLYSPMHYLNGYMSSHFINVPAIMTSLKPFHLSCRQIPDVQCTLSAFNIKSCNSRKFWETIFYHTNAFTSYCLSDLHSEFWNLHKLLLDYIHNLLSIGGNA